MAAPSDAREKTVTAGFGDPRKRAYLNADGADHPLRSPVAPATLDSARRYRLSRLRLELQRHDCAAALLYDPVNIRYALDASNMQVWTLHNAYRYALVFADGPAVMFEFKGCEHLCRQLGTIDEIRTATSWTYMSAAENLDRQVRKWAGEIAELMARHGGGNRRIAIDKIEPMGLKALEAEGFAYVEGQELTEKSRAIKSPAEMELIGWSIRVCEAALVRMRARSEPGRTEQEIWAELNFENARSGGEWIETRLLKAGPGTNPWYGECSDYAVRAGDMISVDTDMIGPYGYCADLSRSWVCGERPMTDTQRRIYGRALDQIHHNLDLVAPGTSFREFNEKSWRIPERHQPFRYSLAAHGVGLADEWPIIPLHPDFADACEGRFEPGMVICVESLMGEEGSECVKLETQVLVTETGHLRLDGYPFEEP
jgi:Xaa-Pro aminopeptidase